MILFLEKPSQIPARKLTILPTYGFAHAKVGFRSEKSRVRRTSLAISISFLMILRADFSAENLKIPGIQP